MTRRDEFGRFVTEGRSVSRRAIADVFRAAAAGHQANGDREAARQLRATARRYENRDGWRRR